MTQAQVMQLLKKCDVDLKGAIAEIGSRAVKYSKTAYDGGGIPQSSVRLIAQSVLRKLADQLELEEVGQ